MSQSQLQGKFEGKSRGKLYVVGIGPGSEDLLTLKAVEAIKDSDYVIGHTTYINRIRHLVNGEIIESGMGKEVQRVRLAVKLAKNNVVSLVSGGDPSIYGMLPLLVEYIAESGESVEFEAIPGVTALSSASPLLGAPVSGDHAVISLSDLLTPWDVIERRLRHALKADFVIAVYNPSSRKREGNLVRAMKIVIEERGDSPIGIVKNASREGEEVLILNASDIISNPEVVDMNTLLFIPNSETLVKDRVMYTPRGYSRKYRLVEGCESGNVGREMIPERKTARKGMRKSIRIDMGDYTLEARKIVEESYKIVEKFVPGDSPEDIVLKRCVIATGDPGIKDLIVFKNDAINAGIEALHEGRDIVVDVEMVRAGINKKKLKSDVYVAVTLGSSSELTRSADGLLKLRDKIDGGIVCIGNAPSAAIALHRLVKKGEVLPRLIIGTPVGFINAAESKEMLRELDTPSITTVGTRGGSTLCVAILNALINLAFGDGGMQPMDCKNKNGLKV